MNRSYAVGNVWNKNMGNSEQFYCANESAKCINKLLFRIFLCQSYIQLEMKTQESVNHMEQLHIQFPLSATADHTSSCTITIVHDHTSCWKFLNSFVKEFLDLNYCKFELVSAVCFKTLASLIRKNRFVKKKMIIYEKITEK